VLLDGRPVRTPARAELVVPCRALAAAIAEEWGNQGVKIDPASMPLLQLANTAIDRVAPQPGRVVAETLAYAETDLVCHWAAEPAMLLDRQRRLWQPLLDWAAVACDAPLQPASGVMAVGQPPAAIAALQALIEAQDPFRLTGLYFLTCVTGSLVIALAISAGRVDIEAAWAAAQLEEDYQIEQWGEDPLAAERRRGLRADLEAGARFLSLLSVPDRPSGS
jgi:chaperone required for assembly of F1-ATPase